MERRGKTITGFRQVVLLRALRGPARPHVMWVQAAGYEQSLFPSMAG